MKLFDERRDGRCRLFGFSILIAAVLNLFLALALSAHPHTDFIVLAIQVCQGLSLVNSDDFTTCQLSYVI